MCWLSVAGVVCAVLWLDSSGRAPGRGYGRGDSALVLASALAAVLCGLVVVQGLIDRRRRARWCGGEALWPPAEPPDWPGFRVSCGVLGLVVIGLVGYHIGVGFEVGLLGRRTAALLLACVSGGCGVALLVLVDRRWSVNLAEIGMALMCLAACCGAMVFLPAEPVALGHRYPLVFNAVLIALAGMSWLWCWLSSVWLQQLDAGVPWTTAGRMIEPARRVAFFSGLMALAVGWLMTVWPRLGTVATMDHSLGRIAAGVAGHLLLLLAVLWSGRRTGRASFTGLAVLTVTSLLAFVYVRTVPLATVTL